LIPPLRERRDDIFILGKYFLNNFSTLNNKEIEKISSEARDLLLKYDYPGNVRELENIIERAVVISRGPIISIHDLPFKDRQFHSNENSEERVKTLKESVEALELKMIKDAMEFASNHQTKAAKYLGISERMLRYKLKKYKLK